MSRRHRPFAVIASAFALAGSLALGVPATSWSGPQAPDPPSRSAPSDDDVEDRIAHRFETNDAVRKYDVKVDVEAGVAQITGRVATEAQKAQAEMLAAGVDGVQRVESHVAVDPAADQTMAERAKSGLSKAGEAITDAWITTKVTWFVTGEDTLVTSRITVDTRDGVVTLKGTVANEAGRARALRLAQRTEGVTHVIDQLTVAPPR